MAIPASLFGQFLDRCAELDSAVARFLEEGWNTNGARQALTMGLCRSALEHVVSQRVLLGAELHGTALALIRLHFETTVRAAWVLLAAKQSWIDNFITPVPIGSLAEPTLGPPIPSMLAAIETVVPDMAVKGREFYGTAKVMHSFVHGGAHLVAHGLRGHPLDKLTYVLRNRNMLLLMLCNVIVVASGKQALHGSSVSRLSRAFSDVMPPLTQRVGQDNPGDQPQS